MTTTTRSLPSRPNSFSGQSALLRMKQQQLKELTLEYSIAKKETSKIMKEIKFLKQANTISKDVLLFFAQENDIANEETIVNTNKIYKLIIENIVMINSDETLQNVVQNVILSNKYINKHEDVKSVLLDLMTKFKPNANVNWATPNTQSKHNRS